MCFVCQCKDYGTEKCSFSTCPLKSTLFNEVNVCNESLPNKAKQYNCTTTNCGLLTSLSSYELEASWKQSPDTVTVNPTKMIVFSLNQRLLIGEYKYFVAVAAVIVCLGPMTKKVKRKISCHFKLLITDFFFHLVPRRDMGRFINAALLLLINCCCFLINWKLPHKLQIFNVGSFMAMLSRISGNDCC